MYRILILFLISGVAFTVVAEHISAPSFHFKLSSSQMQVVDLAVIGDKTTDQHRFIDDSKKSVIILRSKPLSVNTEVILSIDSSEGEVGRNPLYKVTGYKINYSTVDELFRFISDYEAILRDKYPDRFVIRKQSCVNRHDDFFHCLFDEKERWNILFFVNNGEITLSLLPVADEKSHKIIGGSVVITYTIGTGKVLDHAM